MKQAPVLLYYYLYGNIFMKQLSACGRRVYDIGLILQSFAVMVASSYQSEIFSSGT